jgi:hypothetical protein
MTNKKMQKFIGTSIIVMLLVLGACKKDAMNPFSIKGKVTDARNGSGLAGVTVKVEKQSVQDGVYTNTYQRALTTTTGNDGHFEGSWERETFASLKLLAEKTSYIPIETILTEQEIGSGEINKNITMHPEAFASLRFMHNGTNSNDELLLNYTNTNFDCACCKPGWKTIVGAQVDTTFSCKVYGDHWLVFKVITKINNIDSSYTDSVFCPAFIETRLDVAY